LVFEKYDTTSRLRYIPLLFTLCPYLTHRVLPDVFRIETGAIEEFSGENDLGYGTHNRQSLGSKLTPLGQGGRTVLLENISEI